MACSLCPSLPTRCVTRNINIFHTSQLSQAVEMWDTPEQGVLRDRHAGDGGDGAEVGDDGGLILVPMVVQMAADDQSALLGEWVSRRWPDGAPEDAVERATQAVQALVQHFGEYGEVGVPVFTVSLQGFSQALDAMHDYLLACIELAMNDEQRHH